MTEAKDTVMSPEQLNKIRNVFSCVRCGQPSAERVAKAQAEISFKAGMKQGIWLFAWWKDGVQYVGTSGRTLAEAYKELEIE